MNCVPNAIIKRCCSFIHGILYAWVLYAYSCLYNVISNLLLMHGKIKDTPSYSLGSRPKDAKIYVTPAPGAYESCDTNQYKSKAPGFSLSTRYVVPSDVAMKPGPGAYTPEKVFN